MSTIFEGQPLPNVTTTTTDTGPSWFTNPLTQASTESVNQMKKTAAQGLAALDPYQIQGYKDTSTAAGSYASGLQNAETTAGQAASAMNPASIQQFMNPYINTVTNEQARLANQNFQRNILPGLSGAFVGTGGLGSQRYASALGQTGADFQANLTGQQNKSLADAYKSALDASYNQGQLQNAAAQTQGALAGKEQELGLKGASALTAAGAAQQQYEQSKLDYPLTNAINSLKFLSGITVPTTRSVVGPGTQGQYSQSPFNQVVGIGSLLGSIAAGGGAGATGAAGQNISQLFSRALSGLGIQNPFTGGSTNIDPTEFTGSTNANGVAVYFDQQTGKYYDSTGKFVPIVGSEGE
jgi:hypothetical protein